jgi:hypothetical protein
MAINVSLSVGFYCHAVYWRLAPNQLTQDDSWNDCKTDSMNQNM